MPQFNLAYGKTLILWTFYNICLENRGNLSEIAPKQNHHSPLDAGII